MKALVAGSAGGLLASQGISSTAFPLSYSGDFSDIPSSSSRAAALPAYLSPADDDYAAAAAATAGDVHHLDMLPDPPQASSLLSPTPNNPFANLHLRLASIKAGILAPQPSIAPASLASAFITGGYGGADMGAAAGEGFSAAGFW